MRRRIEAGEILRGLSRGIEQNKPALEGIERGFVIGSDREELLLAAAVHSSLKGGARNELRDLGSRDGDGVARSGVATGAFRTILKLERAEANERKGLAALNSSHNFFDHRTENAVGFCLGNGILFGNLSTRSMRFIGYLRMCLCNVPLHRKKSVERQQNRISDLPHFRSCTLIGGVQSTAQKEHGETTPQ